MRLRAGSVAPQGLAEGGVLLFEFPDAELEFLDALEQSPDQPADLRLITITPATVAATLVVILAVAAPAILAGVISITVAPPAPALAFAIVLLGPLPALPVAVAVAIFFGAALAPISITLALTFSIAFAPPVLTFTFAVTFAPLEPGHPDRPAFADVTDPDHLPLPQLSSYVPQFALGRENQDRRLFAVQLANHHGQAFLPLHTLFGQSHEADRRGSARPAQGRGAQLPAQNRCRHQQHHSISAFHVGLLE
jgi:hypothetical protein